MRKRVVGEIESIDHQPTRVVYRVRILDSGLWRQLTYGRDIAASFGPMGLTIRRIRQPWTRRLQMLFWKGLRSLRIRLIR